MKKALVYSLISGLLCITSFAATTAGDAPKEPSKANTFTNKNGVAIDGYDVVAYFNYSEPRLGKAEYAVTLDNGVTYWFSSEETQSLFNQDPDRYLPQYGGFCAYAMAKNEKVEVDPTVWTIVDGKLYLNASKGVCKKWKKKQESCIKKADKNWCKRTMKGKCS